MVKAAERVVASLTRAGLKLALAESCTGGMLAAAITDVPGASACFEASYVTYSRKAKEGILGLPSSLLERYGTVSGETASSMAARAREASGSDIACAVTGVAGPGPDAEGNPEGLVYIACSCGASRTVARRFDLAGNRGEIRAAAVSEALGLIEECIKEEGLS
ncbi:MAG: CinA family protein [Firmicutes bacterium]|nr:CinA family protein [Bacillota bacterium]